MLLCSWEELPENMRTPEVRPYFEILAKRKAGLVVKRVFDVVVSVGLLLLLWPLFLLLAIAIKLESKGPVFYRQTRVTQFGRLFKIHKFRSMCDGADQKGSLVTVGNDMRITRVGKLIRNCRLDELSQLIDVLEGTMTFVGTRPEVPKYVNAYTPEMMATLLLPAGVTSMASINYKEEASLLDASSDVDKTYIQEILPEKMKWNLEDIRSFSFGKDLVIMLKTVVAVIR
jgi:lipopolysaccharide/colanic/teichoic acid biosynthesis glycosyltransferase